METNSSNSENSSKKVERSAAYPGITLEDAIVFTTSVSKNFTASQIITREDIAAVLGKSVGSIVRDVAASTYYGLFTRHKDGYQLTSLIKAINNPLDEKEKRKSLVIAFQAPKLYQELIEKFNGHAIPTELRTHLLRFHGISEKAASDAAEVFIQNGKYCGVLSENNILNVTSDFETPTKSNVQFAEVVTDEPKREQGKTIDITPKVDPPKLLPSHDDNVENVKIRLTGIKRYAYLTYPDDFNRTDLEIIKKEIEKLEIWLAEK
jgi:hypothetical protein